MRIIISVLLQIIVSATFGQHGSLEPMLNPDVIVPNGGIYRLWKGQTFQKENIDRYIQVFEESPYQKVSGLIYSRLEWKSLEGEKGVYRFDQIVTPILEDAYYKKCRVSIGFAIIWGTKSSVTKIEGRYAAIPKYLFEELQKSEFPCKTDDLYGEAWAPDYDSPLLENRYNELLKAFSRWLEKPFGQTGLNRKDIVFAIEMRYFGYWGEGAVRTDMYPKTNLINKYLDSYVENFPDILLIAGGHETIHLPNKSELEYDSLRVMTALNHVSKVFSLHNNRGPVGIFIDSWQYDSEQYDSISKRVICDQKGQIVPLANYLSDNIYGKRYITGEFDFFGKGDQQPYGQIEKQIRTRHVSGMTVHNLRAAHEGKRLTKIPEEVFRRMSRAVSAIGYRFVVSSIYLRKGLISRTVELVIHNIGVSNVFADYYEVHFIIKNEQGQIIKDYKSDFDIRNIVYGATPLEIDFNAGITVKQTLFCTKGHLYLKIIDKKGIEHPLTLSNYGREVDGSYYLGKL